MQPALTAAANPYDAQFYIDQVDGSIGSARVVVPLVTDLSSPASVVDVGCGTGCWLREFATAGVADYLGIDGDYIDPTLLQIPRDRFLSMDLASPRSLDRTFDLAMSLEVAEHLPKSAAPAFVEFLVGLAPVVMFSAAVPNQGGTQHINEQWPWYWRSLFESHGYIRIDAIRPMVVTNPNVEFWYRQNVVIFVDEDRLANYPKLQVIHQNRPAVMLELITEVRLKELVCEPGFKAALRHLPRAAWRAIQNRISFSSPITTR